METKELLEKLGFSNKKAKIYLTCLELSSATAKQIAKKSDIVRTTTYKILDELTNDGLIEIDLKHKTKNYVALDPNKIINLFEEKKKTAESCLPDLLEHFSSTKFKPKITFYDGENGIKKVFEDILNYQDIVIYTFSPIVNVLERFGRVYARHFIEKRRDRKIIRKNLRQLTDKSEEKRDWEFFASDKMVLREVKFLPKSFEFSTLIQIYDNKISVISSEKENFGFIIESKELASFMKQVFNLLWATAKNS
ncbi:MAG: hypothetical protein COV55_03300 [Candidatus Komeilibacteria bacterium CG11_big_fil_rev_8_21_14_0_20_36_20]|uniref:Transcription regulator TrmB N-terminal domain-containing protein n=1 Tax=Candidatus Komeilibacteria bacterium CG11_big_fil_rev_8_21_14_0_20_36_20 TaxID=1974477 RepID=A0A2H0NCE1_9BACT|nr:MAG: hypothetical protein COV55_03300 [Candidatus Komeilibacteria bacterium CG11_big_fil_rev_8_21_14_0_20_36_20]PIR81627.1 MAG: hypothetical protein COU21_02610 [Candidatus Komeilibacteria bacterium CG10_big_fil_rev_8_21_14_0_10_36_65]PJC55633.1 MAG: hypothetical protein CO027_01080 [Candidatus Komeilibacteria bacterium CG_4_9_14_0_2_um_filter_36_13]